MEPPITAWGIARDQGDGDLVVPGAIVVAWAGPLRLRPASSGPAPRWPTFHGAEVDPACAAAVGLETIVNCIEDG